MCLHNARENKRQHKTNTPAAGARKCATRMYTHEEGRLLRVLPLSAGISVRFFYVLSLLSRTLFMFRRELSRMQLKIAPNEAAEKASFNK